MEAKRVILIGCGKYASDSHLPALKRYQGKVNLTHVVELSGRMPQVKAILEGFGFDPSRVKYVEIDTRGQLEEQLPSKSEVDGCIVATDPANHYQYLVWSLGRGLPTLVDKPLTFRANASTDLSEAKGIAQDCENLLELARREEVPVFMVGTQKRYQRAYQEMAGRVKTVFERTGYPITSVECSTSDGYWLLPGEYKGQVFHSYMEGGGKLIHTGYHFLDIIPWLMRFASSEEPQAISHAWVVANLFRPSDSVRLMGVERIKQMFPEYDEQAVGRLDGYGDINTYILVRLCDEYGFQRAVINYSLLHEGFSLRSSIEHSEATAKRTKIDHLALFQGPVFHAEYRRTAKIKPEGRQTSFGGANHYELNFAANPLTGLPRMERLFPRQNVSSRSCGDDQRPTTDFLQALLDQTRREQVLSPATDHVVGVKLLSAAYQSAAEAYMQAAGMPVPIKVDFGRSDWNVPPAIRVVS